jgi:hypothetical protein
LKLGVPENAIEAFGHANKSTTDEAVTLSEWTERNRALTITIPTGVLLDDRSLKTFRVFDNAS